MDIETEQADSATGAFTAMRDKLAGLTFAIDSMAGAWKALLIPDYSETLERIAEEMAAMTEQLEALAEKPGLKLTPESLSAAIIKAGKDARVEDHAALTKATTTIEREARAVSGALAGARAATEQRKMLQRAALGGTLAGAFLWATFAGFIARSLPESWHLPERMAARTLRLDMWNAGGRLMETSNPEGWHRVVRVAQIGSDNRQTIENCVKMASKRRVEIDCSIKVKADNPK